MRETEFEQALEESIRKAVETALKAYEAAAHNDTGNAIRGESAPSYPSIERRAEQDEIESLRRRLAGADDEDARHRNHGRELPPKSVRERAHPSRSPHRHGGDAPRPVTPRAQDGGSYHTAIRQHTTQPDRLFDSLAPYCSREKRASAATQFNPPGQEYKIEDRASLHTAIEQLRQDMNRNHSEAANVATRKNHSRP
ncbi:MAG: hypothetical protein ACAI37_15385 [Chthoniobacter sp.]